MMRALALIAALVCASAWAGGPRNMNTSGQGGHLNVPLSAVVARYLSSISTADECTGAAIPGVTFTRSSSATCTKSDGTVVLLAADKPRVESTGLRVEGGATNLLLQSEAFDDSAWTKATATVTANAAIAPDGNMTADRIQNASASGNVRNAIGITVTSGGSYVFSFYAKNNGGTVAAYSVFCASAGTDIISSTSYFSSISSTKWTRISVPFTATGCTSVYVYPHRDGGAGTDLFVWGAQLETGSIATSYIPTTGTSAARTAETATVATPAGLSTSEGCAKVCVTPDWTGVPATEGRILDADLTSSNARLLYAPASVDAVRSYNGTTFPAVTAGFTAGTRRCYIARWSVAANSLKVERLDNSTSNSVAFSGFPSFDSTIGLGSRTNGASPANAALSDIQFGRTSGACR